MLLFIGFFPYCLKTWWNKLLREPLCHGYTKPLFDVLARVMWRTEKKDVLDQVIFKAFFNKIIMLQSVSFGLDLYNISMPYLKISILMIPVLLKPELLFGGLYYLRLTILLLF